MLFRSGEGTVPNPSTVVQEGDLVHAILDYSRIDAVIAAFAAGPPPESGH